MLGGLFSKYQLIALFIYLIKHMLKYVRQAGNDQTNRTQHNLYKHMHVAIIPITSTNIEIFNNFIYRNIYSLMMIRKD